MRVAGLEPATYWFVASCAIQLRHIRICDDPNIELAKYLSRGIRKIFSFFLIFLLEGHRKLISLRSLLRSSELIRVTDLNIIG